MQGYFTNVVVISTVFALINAPTIGIWAGFGSMLRNVLRELESRYDVVVMDAPPSFGLLNLNALVAADTVLMVDFQNARDPRGVVAR